MVDGSEVRRRAQPLLDRPPYEALPLDELRARRTAVRTHRTRRRLAALGVVVVLAAAAGAVALRHDGNGGGNVAVRTTGTAPPVTAPTTATITDLRFTPIAGPDGGTGVALAPVGDHFFAFSGDPFITRVARRHIGALAASSHCRAI